MQADFQQIPIKQLRLSQTEAQIERRAHFDKPALAELAGSLSAVGMLQPLVVRPFNSKDANTGEDRFEVVAGERRFMAAGIAKWEAVPCNVRDLSDQQVLEVQLVENLQREGLHELAEAEGYEGLMKLGFTADQVAEKCGRSKAYVYSRLKLIDLCKEARKAFYDGKLTASTALYLARIPLDKLQLQALKQITDGHHGDEPMSAREAQRHIHDNYMLRLGDAGFKTDDATLVPAAGACGACPKRTGNQPELFGDVKGADVCTDPVCFKSKLQAHAAKAITAAKANGQPVIQGPDAKKVLPYDHYDHMNGYVKLDERNYNDKGTYRQSLGKDYVPTLLVHPHNGKVLEVAPLKDVRKPDRAAKSGSSSGTAANKASQKAADAKRELEGLLRKALARKVFEKLPAAPNRSILVRAVYEQQSSCDNFDGLLVILGLAETEHAVPADPRKMLTKMSALELQRLLVMMSLEPQINASYMPATELLATAKELGIEPAKVRAEVVAAQKAATPTTAAKAPKKKAAKK